MSQENPNFEYAKIIKKDPEWPKWLTKTSFVSIILLFLLLIAINSSYYKVDTDESAVVLRLGKYHRTTESGLYFKLPLGIERVFLVKTARVMSLEFGFRSIGSTDRTQYQKGSYAEESLMLTGDLNVIDLEYIIQFRITDPYKYLFRDRDPQSTIRDISEAIVRRIVGDTTVSNVLTVARASLAAKVQEELQKTLDEYDIGVMLVTVRLQDANPPDAVKAAFNSVNEAEQQRESLILQAQRQYNEQVPRAKGEAMQLIDNAEGYALQRVNLASGEASRFLALLEQYETSPDVTRTRMYLESIEKVVPALEKLYIIDKPQGDNLTLPLLPLSSFGGKN